MSTWGMSYDQAVSLTERQVAGLLTAYIERKKFEAKILLSLVAEALKPQEKPVSFSDLSAMGFEIQGA